jgi:hypothetical protein
MPMNRGLQRILPVACLIWQIIRSTFQTSLETQISPVTQGFHLLKHSKMEKGVAVKQLHIIFPWPCSHFGICISCTVTYIRFFYVETLAEIGVSDK